MIAEQIKVTTSALLGLTVACAQCHDHKYDPMSQEEYYRLFAFLNNDHESSMVAYSPTEQRLRDQLARQIREEEEKLRHTTPDWEARMAAWEASVRGDQPEWTVVRCEHVGDKFAEEARKIHYGESDKRGIYGETSEEEAEALAEEGIEFGRLPWIPRGN